MTRPGGRNVGPFGDRKTWRHYVKSVLLKVRAITYHVNLEKFLPLNLLIEVKLDGGSVWVRQGHRAQACPLNPADSPSPHYEYEPEDEFANLEGTLLTITRPASCMSRGNLESRYVWLK